MANISIAKRTRLDASAEWGAWVLTNETPPYVNTDLVEYAVQQDIEIEKRTRTTVNDEWSEWATTADPAPFVNTELVEYRQKPSDLSVSATVFEVTDLNIENLVNGSLNAQNEWEGTGIFDKLIAAVNKNIEGQYNKNRITGPDYANVYLGSMQSVIAQSMEFLLRENVTEAQVDLLRQQKLSETERTRLANAQAEGQEYTVARILPEQARQLEGQAAVAQVNKGIAYATQQDKIDTSSYKKQVEEVNKDISVGTKTSKIALVAGQVNKLTADTNYVGAQQTALEEQVEDNRLIKAIDALGDTYGTFGAGGLTVSSDMWATYYGMITSLTTQTAPNSTTVTKVT